MNRVLALTWLSEVLEVVHDSMFDTDQHMDPVGYAVSSTVNAKVLKRVSTDTAQTRPSSSVSQRCSRGRFHSPEAHPVDPHAACGARGFLVLGQQQSQLRSGGEGDGLRRFAAGREGLGGPR